MIFHLQRRQDCPMCNGNWDITEKLAAGVRELEDKLARAHLDVAVEKEAVHQLHGEVAMLREALARTTEQHRRVEDLLTQAESDRDFAKAEFQIANQQLAAALRGSK